jgi:hypothetical protein
MSDHQQHLHCVCINNSPLAFPEQPLEFFQDLFGGTILDCELFNALVLLTSNIQGNGTCDGAQSFLSDNCCGSSSIGSSRNAGEDNVKLMQQCSLCPDGLPITLPDGEINIREFPVTTCKQLNRAMSTLFEMGLELCMLFQTLFCGYPRKANSCNMCPDGGGSISLPD